MDKKIDEIAQKLKTALKNHFDDFEGLYLYGSQVTGKQTEDSDIDIIAVLSDTDNKEKRYTIWGIVSQLEYNYDVCIDLHPMTRYELEQNYIFHKQVVDKGIYYDAA